MKTVVIQSDKGAEVGNPAETDRNGTAIPSREKDDFWSFQQGRASAVENART